MFSDYFAGPINSLKVLATVYRMHLGFAGMLIAAAGAYYAGYSTEKAVLDAFIRNQKIIEKVIYKKQIEVQTQVVTKYVDRIKLIEGNVTNNVKTIDTSVPDTFSLSNGWVYSYNTGLQGAEIQSTLASDASPSGINAVDALKQINDNDGKCLANSIQLKSLQDYINKANEAIDQANNGK